MLDWYAGRIDGGLYWRNVKKEKGTDKCKTNGGKEVKVLRCFVESGRLLENAETSSTDSHETETLPETGVNK